MKKFGSSQYLCMDETNNFLYFSKKSDTSVKLKNNLKIKMYLYAKIKNFNTKFLVS